MEPAQTDHPVHDLIAARWSPYGFEDRPVPRADLLSLLEAARWAPSSYNEQPWSFLLATRDEPALFQRAVGCLVEGNQDWARRVPVLLLCVIRRTFARNEKPNAAAEHDLGLAAANLTLEATARGLHVHQMIGIVADKVRSEFGIPDGYDPLTAIAVGYAAQLKDVPEGLRDRDRERRGRKPISEFTFGEEWGQTSPIVE